MASRRAVLLTPSLSSRPVQPLSCTQITRETPLIPIFVFKSLRTLSFSVSCKSCVCHSYANGRGGYQQFPTWSESLAAACNPSLTSINRPPLVRCVDSSSPLQLSTFNRVSFPSSHLSLSQRSAKSFTIRTSKTPLPQPLYNPHLQAPLGSAGNKGLITPLESALTKNSPVTPVESALTKRWGVGPCFPSGTRQPSLATGFKFFIFEPFQALLHSSKTQLFCSHAIPHSLAKTPGVGGRGDVLLPSSRRTASVAHPFKGEASPSQVVRVTTHQLQITTHVVLPNRPHRPYHRFRTPSPIMSPPPIPGQTPIYEDYARCIHCGLCLNACPTYRLWNLEADSPRGRIRQMIHVEQGELPVTDSFVDHIDKCLDCRACETACPSGVEYGKLVEHARARIEREYPRSWIARVTRDFVFRTLLPSPLHLADAARLLRLYQRSGLQAIARGIGVLKLLGS